MYTSMMCPCGAHFEVDTDDYEESAQLMMHRFANAHAVHGYMAIPNNPDIVITGEVPGRQLGEHTAE